MTFVSTPTPQLIAPTVLNGGPVTTAPIDVSKADTLLLEHLVTRGVALTNVIADVEVSEDDGATWAHLTRVDDTGAVTHLLFDRDVSGGDENYVLAVDVGHSQLARVTYTGTAADGSESLTVNGRIGRKD